MYSKSFNYALLGASLLGITVIVDADFLGISWEAPLQLLVILLILAGAAHFGLWLIEKPEDVEVDTHWPTEFEQW